MSGQTFSGRHNLDAIEAAYQAWQEDPSQVDATWRVFFEGFELGAGRPATTTTGGQPTGIVRIIDAYRRLGHLVARLDPLSDPPPNIQLLELSEFGLSDADLDRTFDTSHFCGLPKATLRHLLAVLRETYCRSIGVEYMHIQDRHIRNWLQEKMEPRRLQPDYPRRQKLRILMNLHQAELFERFLHTRYLGQKRFSLEGAETLIPLLDMLVERSADGGVGEIVLGMAHRGRLNVLANIIGKPYTEIFTEFEENYLPNSMAGDGDVKYHLGFSSDRVTATGKQIHLSLTPNPSHLEAVCPVVEGRVRAKQYHKRDTERSRILPLLVHGDAAVAGQGLVAETLNLSQLPGYRTGGTIHVVVNNQIGFTTSPADARSTRYCTDVAKMIEVPIFHVNAEDPEACMLAAELAVEFRQKFQKDVFIDMYCYRRHGHNEGDEPSFTQPLMYSKIQERPSMTQIYTDRLLSRGDMSTEEIHALVEEFQTKLQKAQEEVRAQPKYAGMSSYQGRWKSLGGTYSTVPVETGVSGEILTNIVESLARMPEGFTPHPKVAKIVEGRLRAVHEGKNIDWGLAETLAFGSLLQEGTPIRLSGQDCRRGTFSHRHAALVDHRTGQQYIPLQNISPQQAKFAVWDSLLSEAAVLGFDFGYSLDSPESLVMWEAQFGDFANGAQVIIDQFIVCSSSKWRRDSGIVLLLPHGYEGQGPEHSSARLERFLQLCAEENIQVVNATTPAQYFHLLRRQVRRNFRRPLVVMTPKSLLRHRSAVSNLEELCHGSFREVLDDPKADPGRVRRVVLCSGKVYYDLLEQQAREDAPVALVRLEQFYPFPLEQIQAILRRYGKARDVVWVQEESLNMGGWSFIEPRLRAMRTKVRYIGRDASSSPATGSRQVHLREQKELVETALHGAAPHLIRSAPPSLLRRFRLESEGIEVEDPNLEVEATKAS